MIAKILQEVMERAETWPKEDQEELAEIAREIEVRRSGVYVMTDEEREAVGEGKAQARRGDFVPDDEMSEFWKQLGV